MRQDHETVRSRGPAQQCAGLPDEAQFTALRYFALDGTDHPSHVAQASMIRRYIAWRNRHAGDRRLRQVGDKAATIKRAKVT